MKTSEVLEKAAAEVLKPDGWCQNWYGKYDVPEGEVCATGAIRRIEGQYMGGMDIMDIMDIDTAWSAFADHLGVFPSEYNDHPDRTAQEVADAMLECAKNLKERGL